MPISAPSPVSPAQFTPYQKFVVALLAFLQFAVILDFMIMAPLGAVIMPALNISPTQFGLVVSAYAFSAGASGLAAAGFADRFDRKRLLLFFYSGFILGTLWCGWAASFESLLAARILTGLFGGVVGSVVQAIAADLFAPQQRGRVMGIVQTAFSASQVLGIPAGLFLSNHWGWQLPFMALAGVGLVGAAGMVLGLRPVVEHLAQRVEHSPWRHLLHTLCQMRHGLAFGTTALVTIGGFMIMPFSSAYAVQNLGIALTRLPTVYLVTGICTFFVGPLIGRAADRFGKFKVFKAGTALSIAMVLIYTHLGPIAWQALVVVNAVMFVGIFSRMIPFQAIAASVPPPTQRGSFNAISASVQQLSGGVASIAAGHIVVLGADGRLQHFEWVGYVVVLSALLALALLRQLLRSAPSS